MAHPPQQIRFCKSRDGTRIAYATCGSGPPLVRPAHWISHLKADWDCPIWGPWLSLLSKRRTLIRFDQRGCGLSDREGIEFSFEKYVEDLAAVVEAAGLRRFAMFGLDGGAATAIAYAARFPERITHLAIHGCYTRGRIARSTTPEQLAYCETQLNAVALGWGAENPAFRRLFASLLMPEASDVQVRSFNELIRVATTPQNAANLLRAYYGVDLRELATRICCPTLVTHPREDAQISFEEGRMLAALIPGARFVPLESRNHLVLATEPAWRQLTAELDDFLPAASSSVKQAGLPDDLTVRELEVLRLVSESARRLYAITFRSFLTNWAYPIAYRP
jgi:pimeloyl-ACP methyl ester carboxylesterase